MARKSMKDFERLVGKYGVSVQHGGKHASLVHNGRRVGTLATTGEASALRQAVRDLARQGIFGSDEKVVRSVKF